MKVAEFPAYVTGELFSIIVSSVVALYLVVDMRMRCKLKFVFVKPYSANDEMTTAIKS